FRLKINSSKFVGIFIIVAAIVFAPTLMRNSAYGEDGRVIFSVFNIDINPVMYWYQMVLYAVIIATLVIIWLKSESLTNRAVLYEFDEYTFDGIAADFD